MMLEDQNNKKTINRDINILTSEEKNKAREIINSIEIRKITIIYHMFPNIKEEVIEKVLELIDSQDQKFILRLFPLPESAKDKVTMSSIAQFSSTSISTLMRKRNLIIKQLSELIILESRINNVFKSDKKQISDSEFNYKVKTIISKGSNIKTIYDLFPTIKQGVIDEALKLMLTDAELDKKAIVLKFYPKIYNAELEVSRYAYSKILGINPSTFSENVDAAISKIAEKIVIIGMSKEIKKDELTSQEASTIIKTFKSQIEDEVITTENISSLEKRKSR